MYQKENHLKKRKQFNYIHLKGKTISSALMTIKYVVSKSSCYKVGFSVNKKIGNAVVRNHTKRQLREAFRLSEVEIPKKFYFIILAKHKIVETNYLEIKNTMIQMLNSMIENEKEN